jgi:hypothetical protein
MSNRFNILILLLALIAGPVLAQNTAISNAIALQQAGKLEEAKLAIDSATVHPVTANDAYTWYVRGFIYKSLAQRTETGKHLIDIRLESLRSFKKSNELDKGENKEQNDKNIKFLATSFYNEAVSSLDTVYYNLAIQCFNLYKENIVLIDPAADIVKKEVDFTLALASLFTKAYESDRKTNAVYFTKAKDAYGKVLTMDVNNISANYNMGILYYNQAVSIINSMDYDLDMITLNQIQDDCVILFKQSLPFMEKAYQLDPKRKETLIGLSGIYFSLNEEEKSKQIKQTLDEMEKK